MQEDFNIDQKPFYSCNIYTHHECTYKGKKCFGKAFYLKNIEEHNLGDCIEYNEEVLSETNFCYPEHFLKLEDSLKHKSGFIFITERFQCRLNEYITQKTKLDEKQALSIFQQLLKVIYSLYQKGYWHRCLRAEHFVKVGNVWKLESLVLNEQTDEKGESSQYLWSTEHQPAETYDRDKTFTEQEFDEKIVWNLGAILIHMLLGSHKLKNLNILNKNKNSEFKFNKIGAKVGNNFSQDLQDYLGRMCHYNAENRMKAKQLLQSKFFCRQIASRYLKEAPEKEAKIFFPGKGSVSQISSSGGFEGPQNLKKTAKNLEQKHNQLIKEHRKSYDYKEIIEDSQFKKKIENNVSPFNKLAKKNVSDIEVQQDQLSVGNLYKRYIDKCSLLEICGEKFEEMKSLFKNKTKASELITLTKFAVNFVSALDLNGLATAMNNNIDFFNCSPEEYESFQESEAFNYFKILINARKQQGIQKVKKIKEQINEWQKPNLASQQVMIVDFLKRDIKNCRFIDVKYSYRRILKIAYDLVTDEYSGTREQKWARVGMYITYCMAIDKLYIPEDFQDNFQCYFKFEDTDPSDYISHKKFQNYLDYAPKQILVQNSRFVISKYFEV